MSQKKIQPVDGATPDLREELLKQLRSIVPGAFAEGKLDVNALRELLGEFVEERPERYSFSWAGKRDAIALLQAPSRATLIPSPEESVDFENTGNIFIEGDNLEALKLLYKSYHGQVKMIYIDPPYNTGNDFIYPDNFADPLEPYLRLTGQKTEDGLALTNKKERNGRIHSSWLSMMYPRLFLARQLLSEDGVIFVSIDDHEVHNLRLIMNEIFGEENFTASIVWQKKYAVASDDQGIGVMHDYIVAFSKGEIFRRGLLPRTEKQLDRYQNLDNDPRGEWSSDNLLSNKSKDERPTLYYPLIHPKTGKEVWPPVHAVWRYSKQKQFQMEKEGRLYWGPDQNYERPRLKRFKSELSAGMVPSTWWPHTEAGHNDEAKKQLAELMDSQSTFSTPKPVRLIKKIIQIGANDKEGMVLDFFAGSCATAHAVLELNREDGGNRHFIMVQLPEPTDHSDFPTIADIGKERIRRVIKRFNDEQNGQLDLHDRETPEDLGFKVFKLAESNIRRWVGLEDKDPDHYARQMEAFLDPLIEGWKPENILWETALREGYSLNVRIEDLPRVGGKFFQRVTDSASGQSFIITLEEAFTLKVFEALGLKQDDLFICRAIALDDTLAANLALQCRLKTI